MKKKSKQKIDVLPHFQHNNFYKITKYSRITIFLIIYAGRNFIKISSHQPHSKEFTPYLKILVAENPKQPDGTNLDTMKWKEIIHMVKARRRHKNPKHQKDFEMMVSKLDLDFQNQDHFL